jgi:hypothetical protein
MSTMKAHDFYQGRGPDAVYLGTLFAQPPVNTRPLNLLDALVRPSDHQGGTYTLDTWRDRVAALLTHLGTTVPTVLAADVDRASQLLAWPHEYDDSRRSEWAWFFDAGAIYLHHLGKLTAVFYPNGGSKTRLRFPTFDQNGG